MLYYVVLQFLGSYTLVVLYVSRLLIDLTENFVGSFSSVGVLDYVQRCDALLFRPGFRGEGLGCYVTRGISVTNAIVAP